MLASRVDSKGAYAIPDIDNVREEDHKHDVMKLGTTDCNVKV